MQVHTVGIVGHGAFGALVEKLLRRFAPHVEVRIYDLRKNSKSTLKAVAQCDAVVLAVPISSFETVLKKIAPLTKKETIIVDVATVKVHTVNLLRKLAKGRRYIATHPVWGPESYKKRAGDVRGFRIVVAEHTLRSREFAAATTLLKRFGFKIVRTTAEAHDKHLAQTLFLTHFLSQTITSARFDRTEIDTVSFGFLMDAVETVRKNKKLFLDVYRYNPHCKKVLERFASAEARIKRLLGL